MDQFTARTVAGLGRGQKEMVPTLNLDLSDVPAKLEEGIYAAWVIINSEKFPGALHFGPRPAINEGKTCEVHVIDRQLPDTPPSVTVEIVARLRDVENFPTVEALKEQIQADITVVRAILKEFPNSKIQDTKA